MKVKEYSIVSGCYVRRHYVAANACNDWSSIVWAIVNLEMKKLYKELLKILLNINVLHILCRNTKKLYLTLTTSYGQ